MSDFCGKGFTGAMVGGLLLVLGLFGSASPALACSCIPASAPEVHLEDIDIVFKGVVVKTRKGWLPRAFKPAKTEFRVTRAYKGKLGDTAIVSHQLDGGLCGVMFTRGEEILVLAHQEDDETISTGLCTLMPARLDPDGYFDMLETRPAESE
jgi:hypothetical protein